MDQASPPRHASQLEFDLDEARSAGTGAEPAADGRYIYGLQWTEERDVSEIRFHHTRELGTFEVQYWFRNWPYEPPHMPSVEDPVDDPWNGEWLTATAKPDCGSGECRVTFLPLTESENSRAKNLPGVDYRRTIKLRHEPIKPVDVVEQPPFRVLIRVIENTDSPAVAAVAHELDQLQIELALRDRED